jgi:GntR family transcriptional regulator/MocR family aminotransferase
MPKVVSALELPLQPKRPGVTVADWLAEEIVAAIHDGRLQPGTRLPATRDLAQQYRVVRGTVIAVFDQLRTKGLLTAKVGAGTWVAHDASDRPIIRASRHSVQSRDNARPIVRPFRPYEPAVEAFPVGIWSRLTARRWQRVSRELLQNGELGGYWPLR